MLDLCDYLLLCTKSNALRVAACRSFCDITKNQLKHTFFNYYMYS